jgi:hypothetical protein
MTKHRFKKIFVDGVEVDAEKLDQYNQLEWLAYEMGEVLDPETMDIVPMKEETKQWYNGDREPIDYQGRD